jgi:hypothetical protein
MIHLNKLILQILEEDNTAGPGGVLGAGSTTGGTDVRTLASNVSYADGDMRQILQKPRIMKRSKIELLTAGKKRKKRKKK